jgi:hypothetical protein
VIDLCLHLLDIPQSYNMLMIVECNIVLFPGFC